VAVALIAGTIATAAIVTAGGNEGRDAGTGAALAAATSSSSPSGAVKNRASHGSAASPSAAGPASSVASSVIGEAPPVGQQSPTQVVVQPPAIVSSTTRITTSPPPPVVVVAPVVVAPKAIDIQTSARTKLVVCSSGKPCTYTISISAAADSGPWTAVAIAVAPKWGTASASGNLVSYSAVSDTTGTDHLTFYLVNSQGTRSNTADLTIRTCASTDTTC
jgi:hypothetical protein